MTKKLRLMVGNDDFEIDLNDTKTALAIWSAAPFEAYTNEWGGEIYFEVPVRSPLENGRKIMRPGDVAYWPEGRAMCLFYGPTPASAGKEPAAISEVSPIGKVNGDPDRLSNIHDRMKLIIRKVSE